MTSPQVAPYGSWKSPITSDLIVSETVGLGAISIDREDIYWIEVRYTEAGRYVLMRRTPDGKCEDVTPTPYNVRACSRIWRWWIFSYRWHHLFLQLF
jgi:hypothetical protein